MPTPAREVQDFQASIIEGGDPSGRTSPKDSRLHRFKLASTWERLGAAVKDLWNANSPSAVELQALYEEFKGEAERAEMAIESYRRTLAGQRESLRTEFEEAYSHRFNELESALAAIEERLARSEANLAQERRRSEGLSRDLLDKEAEMSALREQALKSQEEQDAQKAHRLADLFASLKKRRDELESIFAERQRALESGYAQEFQSLQGRHAQAMDDFRRRLSEIEAHYAKRESELSASHERMMSEITAWEAKNRKRDEELLRRESELLRQERELTDSYRKKQMELEKTKEEMQRELSQMIRRYRESQGRPSDALGG